MKTKFLFLFTFISFLAFQKVNAKIWRVNNNGYSADFKTLQDANNNNNVLNGDTVHLEGSATAYEGSIINKKLIIIGPGYFLNDNPNTTSSKISAQLSFIIFDPISNGSQLIGVHVGENINSISINASNILIKRCKIDYSIILSFGISDIRIIQNFFPDLGYTAIKPHASSFPTDVIFNNNVCQKTLIINNDLVHFTRV
ncbi:MAG: hypothetical protein WKG06_15230 [Segetibacter sp.]